MQMFHCTIGLLVIVIGFYSYLWYVNKKNQQQEAVFIMVDKIIGEFYFYQYVSYLYHI